MTPFHMHPSPLNPRFSPRGTNDKTVVSTLIPYRGICAEWQWAKLDEKNTGGGGK